MLTTARRREGVRKLYYLAPAMKKDLPNVNRRTLASKEPREPSRFPDLPRLSPQTRILLLILGWVLVLVGILGLVLPGLQGLFTLALGAAALSLISRSMLNTLRYLFRPWPKGWRMILRARRRVYRWLQPRR